MTLRDILNAHKGYAERETTKFRNQWEQVRWLAAVYANTQSKKKIQPADLVKFPWEGSEDRGDEIEKLKEYRKWRTER